MSTTHTVEMPFAGPTPRRARHHLDRFLADHGVGRPVSDDALLVLGELVGNAIAHGAPRANGTIEVQWVLATHEIVLSVEDGGHPGPLHARRVEVTAISGRGLAIIEQLADRWWVETNGGTRVCASLAR